MTAYWLDLSGRRRRRDDHERATDRVGDAFFARNRARILAAFQTRQAWTSAELAAHLQVDRLPLVACMFRLATAGHPLHAIRSADTTTWRAGVAG
jgi:hypothetical protein